MVVLRRLKHVRVSYPLTQRELAQKAGVALATVLHAEHGQETRPSTVRKLAAALDVAPRELIGTVHD